MNINSEHKTIYVYEKYGIAVTSVDTTTKKYNKKRFFLKFCSADKQAI